MGAATEAPSASVAVVRAATNAPQGRALAPLARHTRLIASAEREIHAVAHRTLTTIKQRMLARLSPTTDKTAGLDQLSFAKFDGPTASDKLRAFIADIAVEDFIWTEADREALRDILTEVATERADASVHQVSQVAGDAEIEQLLEQANEESVAWAQARIGNLITDVTATTRDAINELTASALAEGMSTEQFAEQLADLWAFSEERATMIARTEPAFAETAGTLAGYRASGVVTGKGWSADPEACDVCLALDGVEVALDAPFPDGGGDGPPKHPNCLCTVYAVV